MDRVSGAIMVRNQPRKVAETVSANCLLTQGDEAIVAMTTAYNVILSRLIAGEKLTPAISDTLMQLVQGESCRFIQ
jgi:ADP-ribosylglycohydrolase